MPVNRQWFPDHPSHYGLREGSVACFGVIDAPRPTTAAELLGDSTIGTAFRLASASVWPGLTISMLPRNTAPSSITRELLEDLKRRGLEPPPKLAVGDGALGFWAALRKVYPTTREQRCWVHKTANVLDKLPKSMQSKAKQALHDIYLAASRADAEKAFDDFATLYEKKFPRAVECLRKDREELLTFYDFPAEHWVHLRTTNPIESVPASWSRLYHELDPGNRQAVSRMIRHLARMSKRR